MPNEDRIIKSVYVDPKIWNAAKDKSHGEDSNVSRVIRNALSAYVNGVETPVNPSEEIFD